MKLLLAGLCALTLFGLSFGQDSKEPVLSPTPLTSDQVAIYHTFLSTYSTGLELDTDAQINLANMTTEFKPDLADQMDLGGGVCLKGFSLPARTTEVHRFDKEFSDLLNIRLINEHAHKIADPDDAIRNGKSVDNAVKEGLAAGVLTLSEIIFDPTHHLAAFNYWFYCGSLCGNGGTAVFELQNGKWVRSKRLCSTWVS